MYLLCATVIMHNCVLYPGCIMFACQVASDNKWNANTICQPLPTLSSHYVLKIYSINTTIIYVYTL